jgi:predicted solute-binding protein
MSLYGGSLALSRRFLRKVHSLSPGYYSTARSLIKLYCEQIKNNTMIFLQIHNGAERNEFFLDILKLGVAISQRML